MSDSIYNVPLHRQAAGVTYSKNAIVFTKTSIGNSGIPLNLKYYYALKDVPANQPITSTQYWGGYITIKGEKKPHFLWTPSYNLSVTHSPRINTVMFGNGYEQRSPDGIYSNLIRLDVSFDMRNQAEASAILHFLKTRKGTESFIVKNLPPIYADSFYNKRFVCPTFNSNFTFHNNYTMKGTFVETNN
jgi:phage-related protein